MAEGEAADGGVETSAALYGKGELSARGGDGGDGDGGQEGGKGGELASIFASRASAFISRSRAREDAVRGRRGGVLCGREMGAGGGWGGGE